MSKSINVPKLRFKEFSGEWEEKLFCDIVTNKSKKYNPEKESISYKCIELEHLSTESGQLLGYVDSLNLGSIKNKFNKNDVLFGKLRPYLKKYLLAPFDGVCSSEIWVLNGINVTNYFLYYIVQSDYFIGLANQSSGSKMPRADWNIIENSIFFIPSKQEQEKITSFLTSVDTKIEQLTKKDELLQQYKKGVMQKIFNQEIRFKADDGSEFCEWEDKKLGDLTKIVVGGTPSTTNDEYWTNGTVNWLSSGDINNGIIKKSSKMITELGLLKSSAKPMPKDTVVLAMTGATLGRIGYLGIETSGNQSVAGMIPNSKFEAKFLFYTLQKNTNTILSMAGGAAQVGINKATIESLEFSFPCLKEQIKIANFLLSVDSKIEQVQKQLNFTKEFKKALLQQMFV